MFHRTLSRRRDIAVGWDIHTISTSCWNVMMYSKTETTRSEELGSGFKPQ